MFVALGASASAAGALLRQWSHALSIVAGLGIIVMGAHFLGLFRINAMLREARLEVEKPPGLWSAYLMGVAFAFGWTPCIGPILAAILAVAGAQETVGQGACCSSSMRSASARRSSSRRSRWNASSRFRAASAVNSHGWKRQLARCSS